MEYQSAYPTAHGPGIRVRVLVWVLLAAGGVSLAACVGYVLSRDRATQGPALSQDTQGPVALQARQLAELREQNETLRNRIDASENRYQARHELLHRRFLADERALDRTRRDVAQTRQIEEDLSKQQRQAATRIGQVDQQVATLSKESRSEMVTLSGDIAATRKDLDQARLRLTEAIGDITQFRTLIARNHEEFVELARRGERDYREFDLPKDRWPGYALPIAGVFLWLKKVDFKHQRFTLEIQVDDARIEKRDCTVNEPLQFYKGNPRALYEIVVNRVDRNSAGGYLAAPKHAVRDSRDSFSIIQTDAPANPVR